MAAWMDPTTGRRHSGTTIGQRQSGSSASDFFHPNRSSDEWAGNPLRGMDIAGAIHELEQQRFNAGLGGLQGASARFDSDMATALGGLKDIDANLLFSKATDQAGARARGSVNALRSSLGGRGINPNSGAAMGAASRITGQFNADVLGAKGNIAIANQRNSQQNAAMRASAAAQAFANALQIAEFQTGGPVGEVLADANQNMMDFNLAREGLFRAERSQQNASETDFWGGLLEAGAGVLAGGLA